MNKLLKVLAIIADVATIASFVIAVVMLFRQPTDTKNRPCRKAGFTQILRYFYKGVNMALKVAFAVCLGIAVICRILVRVLSRKSKNVQ